MNYTLVGHKGKKTEQQAFRQTIDFDRAFIKTTTAGAHLWVGHKMEMEPF